jgi:formate dehydrogenase major subunit
MYQLFARRFGTNNFPDCSNLCHEPTSVGFPESIGIGKGTVLLDDFTHTEAIFILGQNPGTNSPRMLTELHNASRRKVPIVVSNPLRERALERFAAPQDPIEMATFGETRIASEYCQVRIGGDDAALKGVMKRVLEAHDEALRNGAEPVLDLDFITQHTHGFEAFADDLRQTNWEDILRVCGLPRDHGGCGGRLHASSRRYRRLRHGDHPTPARHCKRAADGEFVAAARQSRQARSRDLPGTRSFQRARRPHYGHRREAEAGIADQLKKAFGFDPPRAHGHNVVNAIQAMVDGRAKVFIGHGGNFVRAVPDWTVAEAAMRRLRLTVAVSTKLNRGHLVHGEEALILPALARSDIDMRAGGRQSITVEDSMSMVHASSGLITPPSEHLKSEVAIVCGMAKATLPDCGIDWDFYASDYNRIRDKIEAVFPDLFANFNEKIRHPGGFHLTNPPRQRVWNTPTGRANFMAFPGVEEDCPVADPAVLRLATLRSHGQYNTTIYSLDDRYRGVFGGRMVVFMNEADMQTRGIAEGDEVEIESLAEDGKRRVVGGFWVKTHSIPVGSIGAYYPETNPLLPLAYHDLKSGTPAAKSIPVLVRPQLQPNRGK